MITRIIIIKIILKVIKIMYNYNYKDYSNDN